MTVAVSTPWLDHLELRDDYMEAISAARPDEVWIVDNGSTPPLDFSTLRLEHNAGFCGGSNAGLNAATTDAVVFLNNDIAMTSEDWLDELTENLEPGVLVGARLRTDSHTNVNGQVVPYLDGWCIAGMRDDLLTLGGFDETLKEPAYFSDNLLCLEARAAGMRLREAKAGLIHKQGATAQPSANPGIQAILEENRARYISRAQELLVPTTPDPVGAHS